MFGLDPVVIALISTIIATIGLKVVEKWLGKKERNFSDAAQIRSELRTQVDAQRQEIVRLEAELDEWRAKFYDLRDELSLRKMELERALEQIKSLTQQVQKTTQRAESVIRDTGLDTEL